MIERPDWGGGDSTAVAVADKPSVPASLAFDGAAYVADLEARHNGQQVMQVATPHGLPAEVEQALVLSPDGREASLDTLRISASHILETVADPRGFVSAFDGLSEGLRSKALTALMWHPGASLPDLLDKIEPKLTLAETAEAERFVTQIRSKR